MQDLKRINLWVFATTVSLLLANCLALSTNKLPTGMRYVMKIMDTWDGKSNAHPPDLVPVFAALANQGSDKVTVQFNATSFTLEESNKFFSPDVFGVMFKGDEDMYTQVELHRTGASHVHLFSPYGIMLNHEELPVEFHNNPENNGTWNGTIVIPSSYLPRAVNSLAAYANFTETPHTLVVFSLVTMRLSNSTVLENPPNLHKAIFFQDVNLNNIMPAVKFTSWPEMWQDLLQVSAGGSREHYNATRQLRDKGNGGESIATFNGFRLLLLLLVSEVVSHLLM